jgi:very-short-patch-repair endonuclease
LTNQLADLLPALADFFEREGRLQPLCEALVVATSKPARWELLREIYQIQLPIIRQRRIDPNFVDWDKLFTPIERAAWIDIRANGIPLYPQVPVLRYFVDFGDPVKKIAVELDGKDWHNAHDDERRDNDLLRIGWRTFRIRGKKTTGSKVDIFDELSECHGDDSQVWTIAEWGTDWCEGFFWALNFIHYRKALLPGVSEESCNKAAKIILSSHCLIYFPVDGDYE